MATNINALLSEAGQLGNSIISASGGTYPGVDGTTLDTSGAGSTIEVKSGGITGTQLASGAVTAGKIGTGGVSAAGQFAAGVVDTAALASNAVTTVKITDANVTTAKLASGAVTAAKVTFPFITPSDSKSADFTAVSSMPIYYIDGTAGVVTMTLPAAPVTGEEHEITDAFQSWGTNLPVVDGNGKTFLTAMGMPLTTITLHGACASYKIRYNGTYWLVISVWPGA